MLEFEVHETKNLVCIYEVEMRCSPGGCCPTGDRKLIGSYSPYGAHNIIDQVNRCLSRLLERKNGMD